jgi:hypothetical protein
VCRKEVRKTWYLIIEIYSTHYALIDAGEVAKDFANLKNLILGVPDA